jgi:integrase
MGIYKKKGSKYYMMTKCINGIKYFQSTGTNYKTEAQAVYERWASELRQQADNGGIVKNKEIKPAAETDVYFSELAERYIDWVKGRQKSYNVKKYIVKILAGRFKNMRLTCFNYDVLESVQTNYIQKDFKPAYINKIITILKHMFTKALDWELIDEEILKKVRKVKLLKGEIKRLRYLSDEEAERLVFNCEPYLKPIVLTALNTGMRRGEIFGLTWDRVDLKNRIILLDKTKNGERREVPINDNLYEILNSIVRRLDVPYVFFNPKTLKPYDNLKRSFATALSKSHILDFRFHDLRHTFASQLIMKGVDLVTVKELLGHKDIKMTLRYSHLSHAHIKNAVNVLNKKSYLFLTSKEDRKLSKP